MHGGRDLACRAIKNRMCGFQHKNETRMPSNTGFCRPNGMLGTCTACWMSVAVQEFQPLKGNEMAMPLRPAAQPDARGCSNS